MAVAFIYLVTDAMKPFTYSNELAADCMVRVMVPAAGRAMGGWEGAAGFFWLLSLFVLFPSLVFPIPNPFILSPLCTLCSGGAGQQTKVEWEVSPAFFSLA